MTAGGDEQALRTALASLEKVCKAEQKALVRLDPDAVACLLPRKTELVVTVRDHSAHMPRPLPADIEVAIERCMRINQANHRMLAITTQTIRTFLRQIGGPVHNGYGPTAPRARGLVDTRV